MDAQDVAYTESESTAMVAFDSSEPATVRNAPAALAELAWQARALSSAVTLPNALRGKPGDILAVMLAGRELGIGPMASTRMVHIISGQTSIATELKLALANRDGHRLEPLAEGPGWCVVHCASHPEARAVAWAMTRELAEHVAAQMDESGAQGALEGASALSTALREATIATQIMVEGWEGERGQRQKKETPLVDKANWRSYQRDMLFWRASAQFMRRHCPALAGGMYTAEELGEGGDDGAS